MVRPDKKPLLPQIVTHRLANQAIRGLIIKIDLIIEDAIFLQFNNKKRREDLIEFIGIIRVFP